MSNKLTSTVDADNYGLPPSPNTAQNLENSSSVLKLPRKILSA